MHYKNILVAVDGSKCSLLACQLALQLLNSMPGDSTLHLLYCTPSFPPLITDDQREQIKKDSQRDADRILDIAQKQVASAEKPFKIYNKTGNAAELIVNTAVELHCDVIVMGSRGLGRVLDAVLGSVSRDVTQASPIPVFLAYTPNKTTSIKT